MTRASAYPLPTAELVERVRALAAELGGWPSQRRIMRECRVGAPRADAAVATLREEGFDPTAHAPALTVVPDLPDTLEAQPEHTQERTEGQPQTPERGAPDAPVEAATDGAESVVEPLVTGAAGAVTPARVRRVPRWPLLVIAAGAFVSIWSGWVGLGKLTGFGPVVLLPGIADEWTINSAITLPLGVEAYAAFAMWAWLSDAPVSACARRFARRSAPGSLALGALGQVAYHLMVAAGVERAPWQITAFSPACRCSSSAPAPRSPTSSTSPGRSPDDCRNRPDPDEPQLPALPPCPRRLTHQRPEAPPPSRDRGGGASLCLLQAVAVHGVGVTDRTVGGGTGVASGWSRPAGCGRSGAPRGVPDSPL